MLTIVTTIALIGLAAIIIMCFIALVTKKDGDQDWDDEYEDDLDLADTYNRDTFDHVIEPPKVEKD